MGNTDGTGLAGVYQKEGKFREALQAYQHVLQSNPECPAAVRVGIGYCLARLDRVGNVRPCDIRNDLKGIGGI